MKRYIIVSIFSGILFGFMDGIINGNSLALDLFQCYQPIAKNSINIPMGVSLDIIYGFVMGGVFLLLYKSLPGDNGIKKGLSFALLIWFFRVVMYAASQWMILEIPLLAILYIVVTGFVEMLVLGLLYGMTLMPKEQS